MTIVLLHGFFGGPEDWSSVVARFPEATHVVAPNLSVVATRQDIVDGRSFGEWLCKGLRAKTTGPLIIAGYSLGGRLAAQAILADPELFSAALLVSAHPGLSDGDQMARDERKQHDGLWADRMRKQPWAETWTAWNAQPVLKPGSRHLGLPPREVGASDGLREARREAWARAMDVWSLAGQPDLRTGLSQWAKTHELALMTGAEDSKFTELTTAWAAQSPQIRHRTVLGAGHRVLLEASEDVAAEIMRFAGPKDL